MLTEKDYCDYETCVALKEFGYKIPTSAYYMPHQYDGEYFVWRRFMHRDSFMKFNNDKTIVEC